MQKVLVNRSGGLSLPRKSVVRLTHRPEMTLDVCRGRKTTKQQQTTRPPFRREKKNENDRVAPQNSVFNAENGMKQDT